VTVRRRLIPNSANYIGISNNSKSGPGCTLQKFIIVKQRPISRCFWSGRLSKPLRRKFCLAPLKWIFWNALFSDSIFEITVEKVWNPNFFGLYSEKGRCSSILTFFRASCNLLSENVRKYHKWKDTCLNDFATDTRYSAEKYHISIHWECQPDRCKILKLKNEVQVICQNSRIFRKGTLYHQVQKQRDTSFFYRRLMKQSLFAKYPRRPTEEKHLDGYTIENLSRYRYISPSLLKLTCNRIKRIGNKVDTAIAPLWIDRVPNEPKYFFSKPTAG
jgi:hypothetical protein